MNDELQKTKKYLLMIPQTLWEELQSYQTTYNRDPKNIGQTSCNRLIEVAIRKFLAEVQ
jgi:hypothetical protein